MLVSISKTKNGTVCDALGGVMVQHGMYGVGLATERSQV